MLLCESQVSVRLAWWDSHALLSDSDRFSQGITDQLIRFSVGIENKSDLINDIEQAISASHSKR